MLIQWKNNNVNLKDFCTDASDIHIIISIRYKDISNMNYSYSKDFDDYGAEPYAANIGQLAMNNTNFRTAIWTGCHMQMTIMCIPPCGEIGLELHEDTDQFVRVEQGRAVVIMGECKRFMDFEQKIIRGDGVFIPAGTWHNIINIDRSPLKLSSIYSPPKHPKGTVHRTKADADREEY